MKETAIFERASAVEPYAKRFALTNSDTDSSCHELSDTSSHAGDYHHTQLTKNYPLSSCHKHFPPHSQIDEQVPFDVLSNDLLLCILGFCDNASTRTLIQTNHRLRNIIASREADGVRREICHREWPWLNPERRIVDDLHIPMHCIEEKSTEPNVVFLLSLASQKMSRVSLSKLLHRLPFSSNFSNLYVVELPDGRRAIQYHGPIGEGNRSIEADRPLPRPQKLTKQQMRTSKQRMLDHRPFPALRNLVHRLCHRVPQRERPFWRPFVAPFLDMDGVHLTPRLISYFEVSIESPQLDVPEIPLRFANHWNGPRRPRLEGDCIVIGVGTRKFHFSNRMAGWDDQSFGYHSDDGGVYHNQGQMIRKFGPTFGVRDTVGCGVDYQRRAIFFTLNGNFLGYAFEKLSLKILEQDLYPVVGLDTHCPVACNFGCEEGFLFDLKAMVCSQSSIVFQSMLIDQN
ncbi:hypothetical protein FisN_18Lh204 [Fistulifera solaris]|uniref:B30.2/SPRY domain-containing protein n=1 Tax=Fistulifera solaris TaxID=1519565 RepID=A0A1Z5JU35_FISSO|nr:hypothetical protein FisN_18Lh204 [Fistulifera solaris]|eukprot:GAX17554.1 hypothetical protein FisN_18Lh204 [Fistulifera solaris]